MAVQLADDAALGPAALGLRLVRPCGFPGGGLGGRDRRRGGGRRRGRRRCGCRGRRRRQRHGRRTIGIFRRLGGRRGFARLRRGAGRRGQRSGSLSARR
ncbi:hypothetical protein E4K66_21410 [Bradyrhizobium frederickii]|uniref:Uncharacterized protein n=1 Tax=Bradyrhizobium frederickii TaxID=2560054 RepID=A0A4Y9L369_9BRAD|nr:hypothetical protein E4K66_21410 [Bradyrhizobium frederickii]